MSYIYIVRHGQSLANVRGGFAGRTDYPLSELGQKQARMTADYLKDTHIEVVLSSPLTRAKQTAAPIAADRGLTVLDRPDFIEMNFGAFEGMRLTEVEESYPGAGTVWKNEMHNMVFPEGESTKECYARAAKAICAVAEEYRGKDICIASHGAFIRCMHCYLLGLDISEIGSVPWADNASVMTLENRDGKPSLLTPPYSGHMGEFATGVSLAMKNFGTK